MIEPLHFKWEVQCDPSFAFALWTERTALWWPPTHTASNEKGATIVFEPRVGGRIYERAAHGSERDWGQVLAWEPPHRLVYTWHLMSDPADATEVEVRFHANGDGTTTVEIEHRGWDRFGSGGAENRDANHRGWSGLQPHYVAACNSPHSYG